MNCSYLDEYISDDLIRCNDGVSIITPHIHKVKDIKDSSIIYFFNN